MLVSELYRWQAALEVPIEELLQEPEDALSTMVTDGTMLKVYAWYDNEMGYACRMIDLACLMQSRGL